MRKTQAEHGQQFIGIRDQIHDVQGQIHSLHGDLLRVEKGMTALRGDVDRVKRRLDLVDAWKPKAASRKKEGLPAWGRWQNALKARKSGMDYDPSKMAAYIDLCNEALREQRKAANGWPNPLILPEPENREEQKALNLFIDEYQSSTGSKIQVQFHHRHWELTRREPTEARPKGWGRLVIWLMANQSARKPAASSKNKTGRLIHQRQTHLGVN